MQSLVAPPRQNLTVEQVLYLLEGAPDVHCSSGCEVLDSSLQVLADISEWLEGGTVTHTANADVHGTCDLKMGTDIDYGTQLLRPYLVLSAGGISARFNCGVFSAHKPESDYGTSPLSNGVQGSDRLMLLNRQVGDGYTIASGTGYLAAAAQVVDDAGLDTSTVLLDSTAADKTLAADMSWPMLPDATATDPSSIDGAAQPSGPTTWLRILNDLLAAVGYRGAWADQDGYYRSGPYVVPADRPVEHAFDFSSDLSIVARDRTRALDLSSVPNKWVFVRSDLTDSSGNPIEPTEGSGQYTVTNQSDGPTSIDQRGGLAYVSVVQLDAADQTALEAQGDARVASDQAVAEVWTVKTAPWPVAGHFDVYSYSDPERGVVKVQETGWTLDLGLPPADTSHTWEVVA